MSPSLLYGSFPVMVNCHKSIKKDNRKEQPQCVVRFLLALSIVCLGKEMPAVTIPSLRVCDVLITDWE